MKERTCLTKRNIYQKILERLSKYKNLEAEIDRMLNVTTKTIPVVTGVLGLDRTGMKKCTNKISGNIKIKDIQNIILLGITQLLRQILFIR